MRDLQAYRYDFFDSVMYALSVVISAAQTLPGDKFNDFIFYRRLFFLRPVRAFFALANPAFSSCVFEPLLHGCAGKLFT